MAKYSIFIDGSSGTTGLKIHKLLSRRKDIEVINIHDEKRKQTEERLRCIEKADLSILCLPDQEARRIAPLLPAESRIIDTSTAHRTDSDWVYGLPELNRKQRQKIESSFLVANPGCHATGFILVANPLITNHVIDKHYPLSAVSLTGYSGGGKETIKAYQKRERANLMESPDIYALDQNHKHLKEMTAMTGIALAPSFLPIIGDYYSGMIVTLPLQRAHMEKKLSLNQLRQLYSDYYRGETLVHVSDGQPDGTLYGSSFTGRYDLEILIYGSQERPVISARYDNLGKGAVGTAVQNMNLMLGITETRGLLEE